MTRFAFITDTHLGGNAEAYQQQTGCFDALPEITAALRARLQAEGVEFVIHGGDMIHKTSDTTITAGAALMDVGVPVHLCLGNHDLTTPDSPVRWPALAPQLFPGGDTDFTVATPDVAIHVAMTHWQLDAVYWSNEQNPHLKPDQLARLDAQLTAHADRPQIVVTHTPIFGLPPEQTGLPGPYHEPAPLARDSVVELASRHPSLRAVLGGHNHMNMCVLHDGVHYVTGSSLAETPFEFKLLEAADGHLSMRTISLVEQLPGLAPYNHDRSYVQGRPIDRQFGLDRAAQ